MVMRVLGSMGLLSACPCALSLVPAGKQLVVEMAEFDREVLSIIPAGFWGCLVLWFGEYRHSNMLHNFFYRLLYVAIHSNHEPALQVSLSACTPSPHTP